MAGKCGRIEGRKHGTVGQIKGLIADEERHEGTSSGDSTT